MIDKVVKCLQYAIDGHVFPGCAAAVYCAGKSYIIPLGNLSYDKDSPAVTDDTIYDVASITKAIPVSALALKLINDGQLHASDKLISYVPQFTGFFREKISIQHLLTQTLSFNFRLSEYKDMQSDQILDKILSAEFAAQPGERFYYANATSILLGMVLEQYTGKTLDKAAAEYFFNPLKMTRTAFDTSCFDGCNIAPSEVDQWRGGVIKGEVHDESAWALRPRIVGSAGLFSTASDLLKFIRMLLDDGICNGVRFFKPETMSLMYTNQLSGNNEFTGLGWELNQKSFMGRYCSTSSFGKTGFTGCSIVIDPLKKVGFVLLSNHIYPHRQSCKDAINRVRCNFADTIMEGL
ncbi:MAG TPA: serine hydrolase domain-containing protein [Chitinispirillaceae bacterium]|nr:serine hydrolase domain-containing protein [Chitinispirillaceae bacterium]